MKTNGYELSNYTSEDVEAIIRVLSFLQGDNEEYNKEHFIWKHQRNPFLKKPVGIVARYEGEVVGFRGFVPAEWRMGNRKFMVLLLCDTVVHPEHRGKGLFSGMTKVGMQFYCDEYRFFVAFTPNQMSAPGNLKLGWKPLVTRKYLRHFSLLGLARQKILNASRDVLDIGSFGDVTVSDSIRPLDISRIDGSNPWSKNNLCLNKNPDFLEWKLTRPGAMYTYFYHLTESKIDAYVILSLRKHHAHVFDYGEEEGSHGMERLISFILERTRFGSISFFNASIPEDLEVFIRNKHFYTFEPIERIRKGKSHNLPVLIRPTREKYEEKDWFVEGIDIRDIDNWHITEICFD